MTEIIFQDLAPELAVPDNFPFLLRFTIDKFHADEVVPLLAGRDVRPYQKILTGNMAMNGGASYLWECARGNGGASTLSYITNANAAIGSGDSSTAEAATHNDLQASTNKLRRGMQASYPTHPDGTDAAAKTCTFQSLFDVNDANWVWRELAVFNLTAAGRMLNRKVSTDTTNWFGTKTVSHAWLVTAALTIN